MAAAGETRYPRTGGYSSSSSDESIAGTARPRSSRPHLIRRDTDQILSYYHSEHAGRSDLSAYSHDHDHDDHETQRPVLNRRNSFASSISSEYSTESGDRHEAEASASSEKSRPQPVLHSQHTRRPSVPTQESVDRRRLAIVELAPSLPPSISRKGSVKKEDLANQSGVFVSSSALLSRRGIQVNGLALVAPPDASPATYTDLTPPPTAPLIASERAGFPHPSARHHHSHSASEVIAPRVDRHRTPRDIGIIGMGTPPGAQEASVKSVPRETAQDVNDQALQVPIFQTPTKSRSPSPGGTPDLSSDSATSSLEDSLQSPANDPDMADREQARTPAIGEEKDVRQPVVGPVVVGLESDHVIRRSTVPTDGAISSPASQYTTYSNSSSHLPFSPVPSAASAPLPTAQTPAMAVQLPAGTPPPRPPRKLRTPLPEVSALANQMPKRNLDSLKESLQLPVSVTTVLASRSSSRLGSTSDLSADTSPRIPEDSNIGTSSPDLGSEPKRAHSVHRREGAFPPSDASPLTPQSTPPIDLSEPLSMGHRRQHTAPAPSSVDPDVIDEDAERDSSGWKLHREASWISLKTGSVRSSSPNGKPQPSPERNSTSPLPPPKTGWGVGSDEIRMPAAHSPSSPFKATLHTLKRFSALPRTPSQLSLRSKPSSYGHSSRTPSPSMSGSNMGYKHRIINAWPEAMAYSDLHYMKTTDERSSAYARKIKEFGMYETGLRDWIVAVQAKKASTKSSRTPPGSRSESVTLLDPSELPPAPRHVSGGSMSSEISFPVRADAYKATDLAMRPSDDLSSTKVPPAYLPYPSLATSSPVRSAIALSSNARTYQVPLSSGNGRSATGFFASIGRKASLKKDRGAGLAFTPPSPSRGLSKRSPPTNGVPLRPIQSNHLPTIPGGPRAVPGRVARSQTISIAPAPVENIAPAPAVTQLSRTETNGTTHRRSMSARRNSLFHRSITISAPVLQQPTVPETTPEFERQVDKLQDLLPHAERAVLAGYLRRAGQDVLAIGQYLEDEKNGALRRD